MLNIKKSSFIVLSLFLLACGPSTGEVGDTPDNGGSTTNPDKGNGKGKEKDNPSNPKDNNPPKQIDPSCDPSKREAAPVKGRLWLDSERKGFAKYAQGVPDPADPSIEGVADVTVKLHLAGGKTLETKSCKDGWYAFVEEVHPDLAGANQGFLEFSRTDCTTNNCATNWTKKIGTDQKVRMVTWGDSIPSFPIKNNDEIIWFPERFKTLAENVVEIKNDNVAQPGSRTYQWKPGGDLHERLVDGMPKENKGGVAGADMIVFSIGGNDLLIDIIIPQLVLTPTDTLIKNVQKQTDQAIANIKETIDMIRSVNPDADILLVSYLNYSELFFAIKNLLIPERKAKIQAALKEAIERHRKEVAGYKGANLVDIYGKTTTPDAEGNLYDAASLLVSDTIHLNPKGHTFHSRQLYDALGGWIKNDEGTLIEEHTFGNLRFIGYPTK